MQKGWGNKNIYSGIMQKTLPIVNSLKHHEGMLVRFKIIYLIFFSSHCPTEMLML